MVRVIKEEYTGLGGWCSTEQSVDTHAAIKIAANCQKGNANLSRSPEEWAKAKVLAQQDFVVYKNPEVCYTFKF